MEERNSIAIIKCEMTEKKEGKCNYKTGIKGATNDVLNVYGSITSNLIESGIDVEDICAVVLFTIEEAILSKAGIKSDVRIPEELKAIFRILGL